MMVHESYDSCWSLIPHVHDLCIRGFARESRFLDLDGRCIPGFLGLLEEYLWSNSVHFLHISGNPGKKCKKCTEEGRRIPRRRSLYPRFAWDSGVKTSDTKAVFEEYRWFPRIPRESVVFGLAALPFLDFQEFPGFPGVRKGRIWSYCATFCKFCICKNAKSARSTGILDFPGKPKSIYNGFGLTALLFQFFTFEKLSRVFQKIWKAWGLSGVYVVQYRVCDRTELMIVGPFSSNFLYNP